MGRLAVQRLDLLTRVAEGGARYGMALDDSTELRYRRQCRQRAHQAECPYEQGRGR